METDEGLIDCDSANEKKLRKLRERKIELQILVQAIEQNLKKKGFEFEDHGYVPPVPQPGIRINGSLSFRGRQQCSELYDRLDEDCDGLIGYDDIRSMRSLSSPLGLVTDPTLKSWYTSNAPFCWLSINIVCRESWQMSMADSGINLTPDAFIDKEQFANYRSLIDPKIPLAPDLMLSGVGYLLYH